MLLSKDAPRCLVPFLSILLVLFASSSEATSKGADTGSIINDLIEWLRAEGGYFSDKTEIRRRDLNDNTSPFGVFAIKDLEANETVLKVPKHVYLQLPEDQIDHYEMKTSIDDYETYEDFIRDEERAMEVYYTNNCRLSKMILDEIQRYRRSPSESKYGPFIRYLEETQSKGQLPATYSQEAKEILRNIQGKRTGTDRDEISAFGDYYLPPSDLVDWIDNGFVARGCLQADDEEAYHAVALAIQRGYDTELVPIWDLYNHDNYQLNLDTNSLHAPQGVHVWTKKPVKAGDELFATYNFCTDCTDGSGDDWGTPGIYRDFGFVEDYPQYWPFLDQEALVEISPAPSGNGYVATFYEEPKSQGQVITFDPDDEDVIFFETHLKRLRAMDVEAQVADLKSPLERYMVLQFYHSMVNAIAAILDSIEDETTAEDDDDEIIDSSSASDEL